PPDAAAGPAHLLVVGDGRLRGAQVHHEAQVGLVEAHAQGAGGDQRLDLVVEQVVLGLAALLGLGAAGVGADLVAALGEEGRGLLGGGDGQRVDDARPGEVGQVLGQPAPPGGAVRQVDDGQVQALPLQGAAQHQGVAARVELLGDVAGDPLVGGGGGGQHRDALGQLPQQGADPPVVGAEVVPPVGDAVRLVDDDQAGAGGQRGQHPVSEVGVVQPLRADQEDV